MSQRIVITIEIPDGVGLEVGPAPTPLQVATPAAHDGRCPVHRLPWKYVPAGVSARTGKPYNAFWSCNERGCNERPPEGWSPPEAA